jgi:hypothetical protein
VGAAALPGVPEASGTAADVFVTTESDMVTIWLSLKMRQRRRVKR